MSDNIIFKKCEFTLDDVASEKCSPNNYESIFKLGFAVTKSSTLCIKGKNISESAVLKLLKILSISEVSYKVDNVAGHPSTSSRKPSSTNEDDCQSNLEDSFIVLPSTITDDTVNNDDFITSRFAELKVNHGEDYIKATPNMDLGQLEESEKLLHSTDVGKEVCNACTEEVQSIAFGEKLIGERLSTKNIHNDDFTAEDKDKHGRKKEVKTIQKGDEKSFLGDRQSSGQATQINTKDDLGKSRVEQTTTLLSAEIIKVNQVNDDKIVCPAMLRSSSCLLESSDDLNEGTTLERKKEMEMRYKKSERVSSVDTTKDEDTIVDKRQTESKETNEEPQLQNNSSYQNAHHEPLPDSLEDLMSEDSEDEEKTVLIMKEKHLIAACRYFKRDLKKYSKHVKAQGEYEITLGKKAESDLILKLKECKYTELMFKSYDQAVSAKKKVSKNIPDVLVSLDDRTAVLYGPKKHVDKAKNAFLTYLGNQDDLTIFKSENESEVNSATATRAQSGAQGELDVKRSIGSWTINQTDTRNELKEYKSFESKASINTFSRQEKELRFFKGYNSNLKVYITSTNITELDVDIIVNAANRHLRHGGGVARAISNAAGYDLNKECLDYISTHGPLDVTDVFVSTGGLLKVSQVMHAVGPRWDKYMYSDKKKCLTDLRRTVLRCLVEASRLHKSSIAIPSISAALFKVPKDLCAKCYMEAVKSFDDIVEKLKIAPVDKIYFVDVDDVMVNMIQEQFMKEWSKPVDRGISQEDFKFSQQHLSKKENSISKVPPKKHEKQTPQNEGSQTSATQQKTSNLNFYQINSIAIHIGTRPATSYGSNIVVVGKLFDELSGVQKFSAKSSAKLDKSFLSQTDKIKCFTLSKPGTQRTAWIYRLYPNPDSPDNVTKAFQNLKGLKEIQLGFLVFSSEIFYPKGKKSNETSNKTIPRFAQMVYEFAEEMSSNMSAIRHITISTSEDCIPQIVKVFDSRMKDKLARGPEIRGTYPSREKSVPFGEKGNTRGTLGGNDYSMDEENIGAYGGNQVDPLVYPHSSNCYSRSTGFNWDVCPICCDRKEIKGLPCCHKLICHDCFCKVVRCPFCKNQYKVLRGNQPKGDMSCFLRNVDVSGYEGHGCFEIFYKIFAGTQTDEHPSPGRPFLSIERKAYLPATDEGLEVLRLLKLAFLRRLIFTIDVSNTTRIEGIVWNIHHKTSPVMSAHGYPDATYLMRLKEELEGYGVTLISVSEEEERSLSEFIDRVLKTKDTRV